MCNTEESPNSTCTVQPESENIPLSPHEDAVHHEAVPKNVKIPSHQRLVTVPNDTSGDEAHSFVLSATLSTIPNAGRGLYLTYRGPNAYWTVPDYVDLGRYSPHKPSDIKRDFMMEIKNFIYNDKPSEWDL